MKNLPTKYFYLLVVFLLTSLNLDAQTFGFGCLGLSGFYAGYSQQKYETNGINDFVKQNILIIDPSQKLITDKIEFKQGTGYRIGANFFRARFEGFFLSAKGYYQFLKEEYQVSTQLQSGTDVEKYQLTMNHWGVGIDLGVPIFKFLDWKIVEGNVMFYNSDFYHQTIIDNVPKNEEKFNPSKDKLKYFLGSGLIFHLVPDYISVEGTAGYNFFEIDDFSLPGSSGNSTLIKNAISKGGFSATVQLNVGFPL